MSTQRQDQWRNYKLTGMSNDTGPGIQEASELQKANCEEKHKNFMSSKMKIIDNYTMKAASENCK